MLTVILHYFPHQQGSLFSGGVGGVLTIDLFMLDTFNFLLYI